MERNSFVQRPHELDQPCYCRDMQRARSVWTRKSTCCLLTAIFCCVVGIITFPIIHWIINKQIEKQVTLVQGNQAYEVWKEPSVHITMEVYLFHLVNKEEVLRGGKPYFVQKGPYTYREHRKKVDIVHDHSNGTVTYRQIKTYHFDERLSVGSDLENITTVNIVLMTLAKACKNQYPILKDVMNLVTLAYREEMFKTIRVRDLVWGYKDDLLSLGKKLAPFWFETDIVGIMAGKNHTDDGVYEVWTGEKNISMLGVIKNYNGARSVNYWSTPYANMINGTDGTVSPPFMTKHSIVEMFSTDVCRSVYGVYKGVMYSPQGIRLLRYTAPKAALASADINPDNAGFCTPPGNCLGTGLLNMSNCQIVDNFHIPVISSSPHFYMADKKYVEAVYGLDPKSGVYSTDFGVEPNTGFLMEIHKRLQINIHIEPIEHFRDLEHLNTIVFPVLWVNESAIVDDVHANQVKNQLLIPMLMITLGEYLLFALLGFAAVVLILRAFIKTKRYRYCHAHSSERRGLLTDEIES